MPNPVKFMVTANPVHLVGQHYKIAQESNLKSTVGGSLFALISILGKVRRFSRLFLRSAWSQTFSLLFYFLFTIYS